MAAETESEVMAERVTALEGVVEALEMRLAEVDEAISRLKAAAQTTAFTLKELSHHWTAVYGSMRTDETPDVGQDPGVPAVRPSMSKQRPG
jgi:hypothetical protein